MNHNYKYDGQSIKAESVCNSKICPPFLVVLFILYSHYPVHIALVHTCSERERGVGICVYVTCKCMWASMPVCIHVGVWVEE